MRRERKQDRATHEPTWQRRWRAVTLALILGTATAQAQPVRIPNSEMPGRERERFIDLPTPKSRAGELLTPPSSYAHGVPKQRRSPTAKPKRQRHREQK
jgi:hypothetical protein